MTTGNLIERLSASPISYQGVRVIMLRMMDEAHARPEGTAGRNFRENKHRLVEGEDYFIVPRSELPTNFVGKSAEGNPNIEVVLLTESGYLLLVKSFRDDRAWQVQRALVSSYFRVKSSNSGDVLLDSLKSLVLLRESQLTLERRTVEVAHIACEAKHLAGCDRPFGQ